MRIDLGPVREDSKLPGSRFGKKAIKNNGSAELKGPGKLFRIRPKIVHLEPKLAPKPYEAKPKMPGAVPTNRRKPIPIYFGPVSGCFDHDQKLLNCEIAQPRRCPADPTPLPPIGGPLAAALLLGQRLPLALKRETHGTLKI